MTTLDIIISNAGFSPTVWVKGDHRCIAFKSDQTEAETIARLREGTYGDLELVTELANAIRNMTIDGGYMRFPDFKPDAEEVDDEDDEEMDYL